MNKFLDELRAALIRKDGAGLTDGQLLASFVACRAEAAFVALVRRHGRMVLGVCQRILHNHHDAEDAFQATFLVLARKAASVQPREAVGNWLYGVANRTALEARKVNVRRRSREQQVNDLPQPAVLPEEPGSDLRQVLDQELSRLPDKYRLPIVLCELEGRTRREVARQLGVPEGTLSSRLATGRKLLAKRLARLGPQFSVTGLPAVVAQSGTVVPPTLVGATVKAAIAIAAGKKVAAGAVSALVVALAEGVLKAMLISKLKVGGALVLAAAMLIGAGTAGIGYRAGAGEQAEPAKEAQPTRDAKAIDAKDPGPRADDDELKQLQQELSAAKAKVAAAQKVAQELEAQVDLIKQREIEVLRREAVKGIASRFKYQVPFEIGVNEFNGGRIDILEVWGTRPKIEIGGQYLVRGKYVLPRDGALHFWETTSGNSNTASGPGPAADTPKMAVHTFGTLTVHTPYTPYVGAQGNTVDRTTLDLQSIQLPEGQGEFTLLHGMAGPGWFHLVLTDRDTPSNTLANVYFGTGDNVLKKKTWK